MNTSTVTDNVWASGMLTLNFHVLFHTENISWISETNCPTPHQSNQLPYPIF